MPETDDRRAGPLAAAWSLAAATLREPRGEFQDALGQPGFLAEARAALDSLPSADANAPAERWDRFRERFAAVGAAGLRREHARILGHAVRGPCPPYEIEYGPEHFLGKSHRLGDVTAFYRAFGVDIARSARERPDHVAVEAEFLSLLALKRARAVIDGRPDRADLCRDAERAFLEDHMGRFLPAFARRVVSREPGSAFAAAAAFAESVARVHAAEVGARLGSPDTELRAIGSLEDETVVTCGSMRVPGAGGDSGEGAVEV